MRDYDKDFREEAIKLSDEIDPIKASEQLGIPVKCYTPGGERSKSMVL